MSDRSCAKRWKWHIRVTIGCYLCLEFAARIKESLLRALKRIVNSLLTCASSVQLSKSQTQILLTHPWRKLFDVRIQCFWIRLSPLLVRSSCDRLFIYPTNYSILQYWSRPYLHKTCRELYCYYSNRQTSILVITQWTKYFLNLKSFSLFANPKGRDQGIAHCHSNNGELMWESMHHYQQILMRFRSLQVFSSMTHCTWRSPDNRATATIISWYRVSISFACHTEE
jgi:hypothetical protein